MRRRTVRVDRPARLAASSTLVRMAAFTIRSWRFAISHSDFGIASNSRSDDESFTESVAIGARRLERRIFWVLRTSCERSDGSQFDCGTELCPVGVPMVMFPGLSELLDAVASVTKSIFSISTHVLEQTDSYRYISGHSWVIAAVQELLASGA